MADALMAGKKDAPQVSASSQDAATPEGHVLENAATGSLEVSAVLDVDKAADDVHGFVREDFSCG